MAGLKDRLALLKGRCAECRFKEVCGGGLRARAEVSTGDAWASDPGCYLTDEEIGRCRSSPRERVIGLNLSRFDLILQPE
jgi:hypothetical protein